MRKEIDINALPDDKFEFAQKDKVLKDTKFETKQVGLFRDAMSRFAQNKGSVVAFAIILFLLLFSIITPFVSGFTPSQSDPYYTFCLPKCSWFEGSGFWDGTQKETVSMQKYYLYDSMGAIVSYTEGQDAFGNKEYYVVKDTYVKGCVYKTVTTNVFNQLVEYDNSISDPKDKILQPLVDLTWLEPLDTNAKQALYSRYQQEANFDYKMDEKLRPILVNGQLQKIYQTDASGNYLYYEISGNGYSIRLNYDNYYVFLYGHKPQYLLGSDNQGRDIMTRLAVGGRLSLILGIVVSFFNIIIGLIYGAIEGYYGGAADMIMERISEILSEVPFMIVVTLFNLYLADKINVVFTLFFAFILTGWLGTASTVRMQFYRYKNQEYVLAARTLGARDSRLIFKHILPNAIGPIITSSVLMVPGVIFSESSLSYLKIIDFSTGNMTSIGTMLSDGQSSFTTNPNLILWPALFISLLMISFNIFGNGLRDAFNPQLRGAE